MAAKQKLRYSSRGWFFHAFDWLAGVVDIRSGLKFPDATGRIGKQEVWVGPFDTFNEAIHYARLKAMKPWADEWSNNG